MKKDEDMPQIIRLRETASTNSYLREAAEREQLAEESLVVAEFQTAGRGQAGNSWESEGGRNLVFSLVLYPHFLPVNRQFLISQITALSVKETLEEYVDGVMVKWPNDIYRHEGKICGMLIENDLSGKELHRSVIGIGININQRVFLSDAPNPVSLAQITDREYDRDEILRKFRQRFHQRYTDLIQGHEADIQRDYMKALYRRDGFYPYSDEGGWFEARIKDVEPTGHLLLELRDGELRRYAFKEVSFVNN